MTVILLSLLSGCFRPDEPLEAFTPEAGSKQLEVPLGEYDPEIDDVRYVNQVFLDLGTGTYTLSDRTQWDLGFATGESGSAVILNSANYMQVARVEDRPFGHAWLAAELEALTFNFDSANGQLQYTAIGVWQQEKPPVYILDRGYDRKLQSRGRVQLQLQQVDEVSYTFRYAEIDGTGSRSIRLGKTSPSQNFVYFSLENGQAVEVAPPQTNWDLVFSYYSYRYPDGIPYWLTGALTNRFGVRAAVVTDATRSWESLTLADTAAFAFSTDIDVIGFDWKTYLFGPPARYVTDTEKYYLLRDTEGYFYKLRFLDFYNQDGLKGFPQLEYALLP